MPGVVTATFKATAPTGWAFKEPVANGRGFGNLFEAGSYAELRLSRDGVNWDVASIPPTGDPCSEDPIDLALDLGSDWYIMEPNTVGYPDYQQVENLWVQVRMDAPAGTPNALLPMARTILVSAELVAAPAHTCDDEGTVFWAADLNQDCYVGLLDLGVLAGQWLSCTDPTEPACGP